MNSRIKKSAAVGAAAVALIGTWEGLRTVAYRDPVGIPTVCFGETRGVKMGDKYTVEQCKSMLKTRLSEFESGMRSCLKNPDAIPDGAYVASLSLAYNIGTGAFCRSTLRKRLDAGDYRGACDEFKKYVYARGIYLPGLANRRAAEKEMCLKGKL